MEIDLNGDVGEGSPGEADLLPLLTTANVAAGFHAGGPSETLAALTLASRYGVRVGVHPGHPDREHFGRRELPRSPQQVFEDVTYQTGAVAALAGTLGLTLTHLKPHGALYHQASCDADLADALVRVAETFRLVVVGPPVSQLQLRSRNRVPFVAEGFADRRYQSDGRLVPRSRPDALINDVAEAVEQADRLIREGRVRTLCLHGDGPQAAAFALALRTALQQRGHEWRAFA